MQIEIASGTIRTGRRVMVWGAVDCMILATARIHNMKVLMGDKHFKGLEETIIIRKILKK